MHENFLIKSTFDSFLISVTKDIIRIRGAFIMFEYFNPNPKNKKVGDCVVRALSKALDQDWKDTLLQLFTYAYYMADMPSSNAVWGSYLKNKGFVRLSIPNSCPDCYTIKDFCIDHPYGTYVVGTGTHTVCVENGRYFDSWDSGDETPVFYYRR